MVGDRATAHQKSYIKDLLDQLEFDTKTVGIMHRRWGVEERHIGGPVDVWLGELNTAQASRLIERLKREAEEEDDE